MKPPESTPASDHQLMQDQAELIVELRKQLRTAREALNLQRGSGTRERRPDVKPYYQDDAVTFQNEIIDRADLPTSDNKLGYACAMVDELRLDLAKAFHEIQTLRVQLSGYMDLYSKAHRDEERLSFLEKGGNIAIYKAVWSSHTPKAGEPSATR